MGFDSVDGGLFFFFLFVFFVFFVFHGFEAFFYDLGQSFHLVLVRGEKLFIFAVDDDFHDVDFGAVLMLVSALVIVTLTAAATAATAFGIDEYRVLLTFIIKIVYDLKFKLIALVIGKNHQIALFFHAVHHLYVSACIQVNLFYRISPSSTRKET